jgi:hypothetical protein
MNYTLTLINDQGFMLEETLDLPVSDDISWQDFAQLSAVKNLLLLNPSMQLIDITPWDMPASFTDEEMRQRQNSYMKNTESTDSYEETDNHSDLA